MSAVHEEIFSEEADLGAMQVEAPAEPVVLRGDSLPRRLVDIVLSAIALGLLSPLLLLVAIAVKLDSRGPAFYSQKRVGRFGRTFRILKFRSMVANAEGLGPVLCGHRDPRITRFGTILRSTKLDELPQLINVLKGDMTLIGPRPEVSHYIPAYNPLELRLLTVRPGLTGLGQLYYTERQAAELDELEDPDAHYVSRQLHPKLAYDLAYLKDRSFWLDIKIVLGTMALLVWHGDSQALLHTLRLA
jgi:lipopolysaccharide/colanic/teichoic acid biosynthesis glycosyltransferase